MRDTTRSSDSCKSVRRSSSPTKEGEAMLAEGEVCGAVGIDRLSTCVAGSVCAVEVLSKSSSGQRKLE
jgi:hypothetical protein